MKRPQTQIKVQGIRVRIGELDAIKLGASRYSLRDPYYLVLSISWPAFFALVMAFYFATNMFFAMLYFAVPGCIANTRPGSFVDHFFFSIETLATVGYGVMSPASVYGHIISSIEIIFGMMSMAVITGLVFTRFSRPRSRVLFSRCVVVAPYEGRTALMLRVINQRHQIIADATARITVVRPITNGDGKTLRRFLDLKLDRASIPMIALSWTLIHIIDEQSPLWNHSSEEVANADLFLLASISGYDESISASIVARSTYRSGDFRFGHDFVDIMQRLETGEVVIDMKNFHETVSV